MRSRGCWDAPGAVEEGVAQRGEDGDGRLTQPYLVLSRLVKDLVPDASDLRYIAAGGHAVSG